MLVSIVSFTAELYRTITSLSSSNCSLFLISRVPGMSTRKRKQEDEELVALPSDDEESEEE